MNPIVTGWYADPEVRFYNGKYWVYATQSFTRYKKQLNIDAFSSNDGINWKKHKNIIDMYGFPWIYKAVWAPTIVEKEGQIDVLVNNAGYALMGSVEDTSSEELKDQFDTNVFGVYRTTKAVLPTMRKQKNGRIITIGSIAGFMGMPIASAYVASKFAIEGFTESLRHEVSSFGIQACVIEPGVIKTHIMEGAPIAKKSMENSVYSDITQAIGNAMGNMMENQSSPPSVVAEAVLKAATSDNLETRYTAGEDAKMIKQARKTKSDKEFEQLISTSFLSTN